MTVVAVLTRAVRVAVRLTSRVVLVAAKTIHGMDRGRPFTDESSLALYEKPKEYRP